MTSVPPTCIHNLLELQASRHPEHFALIDTAGQQLSWQSYQDAVTTASALLSQHNVNACDRVLLVCENCANAAVFIFACSVIGAIAVPVNARMSAHELSIIRAHSEPAIAIFTTSVSPDALQHATAAGAKRGELEHGEIFIEQSEPRGEKINDDPGDVAVILYTTGTTGAPKGVMLSHENLLFAGGASSRLRELVKNDRVYGVLPLTHVFGLASLLMACTMAGATIQLAARFSAKDVHLALMDGVSVFPAVPQMHALLMQYVNEQGIQTLQGSALRYVSSGAAPLDPAWKRQAELFYGIALQNGYGMTETTAGICATNNVMGSADTSVGPPLEGVEIRIDTDIGSGDIAGEGEILTRGQHVMVGYFRNPAATAETVEKDGFLRTGDIGYVDEYGHLHVNGRCKELIIRGGFNVFPPEVEAALNDHPSVVLSAVVGRTLEGGNEEILAFIQSADGAESEESELITFAAKRLAAYKCPTRIIFVEQLPAAATGKILKHKLLELFDV